MTENYEAIYSRYLEDNELLQDDIAKAVALDKNNFFFECYRQSSTLMTFSYMASLAEEKASKLKYRLEEVLTPKLRKEARENAEGKKVTVQEASDYAALQPEYQALYEEYIHAQKMASIFKKVEFAMSHKRDMLQTVNSRQKAELRGNPDADIDRMSQ